MLEKTAEGIAPKELEYLKELKNKHGFLALRAEKSISEAQLAESVYQNELLKTYLRYGLSMQDSIDHVTGKITRQPTVVVPETVNEKGEEEWKIWQCKI